MFFTIAAFAATASDDLQTFDREQLAIFERKAALAKRLGATHVPITDALPTAQWQLQPANDPYPAWFIQRPDFVKLFPPPEIEPFVDNDYGRRVAKILEDRCAILRRLGLKAHWGANIPQVLPETFFQKYPELRGPRVDQPNRSRTARFSPSVDQPLTLKIYAQAMKNLLQRCPEIETFAFLTQDSGSGFDWVPALYPGPNGHTDFKDRPLSDRIATFLITLQNAAKESGHTIEINLNPVTPRQWMQPSFSPDVLEAIIRKLPRGLAVRGREGPDGRPYQRGGSSDGYARGAFYPVVGLAIPDLGWIRGHSSGRGVTPAKPESRDAAPVRRIISLRNDEATLELSARVYSATQNAASGNAVDRLAALRAFAVSEVGGANADALLDIWLLLDDAERRLDGLDFGAMLQFGHVLNRWINRPMVPFPNELTAAEKTYYRPFLFQAKDEEQAENLADIQAMRMYEGFGARLLFQRTIETTIPSLERAVACANRLRDAAPDESAKQRWELQDRRLEAVICLLRTADHMVAYQAQLDRVKSLGIKPESNPPLGAESSWDRTDLVNLARAEIDNTVRLMRLLQSVSDPSLILDLAPHAGEETIMRLGPDLVSQLQRKIDTMNAHWMDYDRLFTKPNP